MILNIFNFILHTKLFKQEIMFKILFHQFKTMNIYNLD